MADFISRDKNTDLESSFNGDVPIVVKLTREPFTHFFTIHVESGEMQGSSEDLDPEETRTWFKSHGADMVVVEKALDECWNFYGARRDIRVRINKPTRPIKPPYAPKI